MESSSLLKSRMHLEFLEISTRDFCEKVFFQRLRELTDDSMTRLDRYEDLAFEMRDSTELLWDQIGGKEDFQQNTNEFEARFIFDRRHLGRLF